MKHTLFNTMTSLAISAFFLALPGTTLADTKVGTPDGNFSVSQLGGATYSVSIDCPKGINGMEPHIALTYNSQSGYGLAGYGVSVSGISAITIGGRDLYHDGSTKGLLYYGHDSFYLDGRRLILDSADFVSDGCIFTVEGDPHTTVTAHGTLYQETADLWFEVHTPNGMTYKYGESSNSRLDYTNGDGMPRINTWYISSAEDVDHNYISYTYTKSNLHIRPLKISYGGNSTTGTYASNTINFEYESLGADAQPFIIEDQKGKISTRLKRITSKTWFDTYRSYELGYDCSSDGTERKFARLTSITEKNGSGDSMNPVELTWNNLPALSVSMTDVDVSLSDANPNVHNLSTQILNADMNGDGIDDIIRISQVKVITASGSGYEYWNNTTYVYISRSNVGTDGTVSYLSPLRYDIGADLTWDDMLSVRGGSNIIDIDGDGNSDLLIPRYEKINGSEGIYFYAIMGKDVIAGNTQFMHFARPISSSGAMPLLTTFDINGDGLNDIVYLERNAVDGTYLLRIIYPQDTTGQKADLTYDVTLPSKPRKMLSGDYNNDGLTDIIIFHDNGYKIYYNRGGQIPVQKFYEWATASGTNLTNAFRMEQGDFNGDGVPDFLYALKNDKNLYFALNNADGTFTCGQAATLDAAEISDTSRDDDEFTILIHDIDNDGKSDAVVLKTEYSSHRDCPFCEKYYKYKKTHVSWFRPTEGALELVKHIETNRYEDACWYNATLGDFDGDGCAELLHLGTDIWSNSTTDATKLHVYKSGSDMPSKGKVRRVTDGVGRSVDISYASLTDKNVYQKAGGQGYPLIERTVPLAVVAQVTATNGAAGSNTANYRYRGLKCHAKGKGLLGFTGTTVTNSQQATSSDTQVLQWNTTKWVPSKTLSTTTLGSETSTTETVYGVSTMGANYFTYPQTVTTTDYDGNVSQTAYTYDTAKGVPLTENASLDGGSYYTNTTYGSYTLAGGRYLPQTVTVARKHPHDASAYSTTTTYAYDDHGHTLSTTQHSGTSMALTTTRTYDDFGNVTSESLSGAGVSTPERHWTYSSNGRNVSQTSTVPDALVVNYIYDTWGNLTEKRELGSATLKTYYTYDGWGEPLTVTSPTGVVTSYSEGWGSSAAQRYYTMESTDGQPWVKTWYDQCGREVLSESIGPKNMTVSKTTAYDARGNVTSVSNTTGALTLSENYSYDNRGRIVSETSGSGRTATHSYGNRTVSSVINGHSYAKTFDAWGNVLTATDPISSVAYTYYSSGLSATTTSEEATVSMAYDQAGHRTSLDDPDAGLVSSVWSADGKLLSQTDARGVTTTYSYRDFGDVAAMQTGSHTLANTYGSYKDKKLQLQSKSMDGNSIHYGYDSYGRPTSETRTFDDGTTLTYTYAYDDKDRLARTVYPGGLAVDYDYDASGHCTRMVAAGHVVYQLEAADGLCDSMTFCGNIHYAAIRDANGNLARQQWWRGTKSAERKTYTFDGPTGNLQKRSVPAVAYVDPNPGGVILHGGDVAETMGGWDVFPMPDTTFIHPSDPILDGKETYTYDALDRLIAVSGNIGAQSMTINYGAGGNILSKSSVGNYSYDADEQPHAVKGVTNPSGKISSLALETVFGDLNRIEMMTQDTWQTSFTYGPDMQRWRSVTEQDGATERTVLYGGDYERVTEGSTPREFYYLGHDVIIMKEDGTFTPLLAETDHLGSITAIVDSAGNTCFTAMYDAWGKQSAAKNTIAFHRGYCGHEMLPEYGLINMNGRLYDPLLGRFLSPDNYVQEPAGSQNFNRYSYCLNNPLKYTDPSGELAWFVPVIAGAVIGAYTGASIQSHTAAFWNWSSDAWKGGIVGGIIGGALGFQLSCALYGNSSLFANPAMHIKGLVEEYQDICVLTKAAGYTSSILVIVKK